MKQVSAAILFWLLNLSNGALLLGLRFPLVPSRLVCHDFVREITILVVNQCLSRPTSRSSGCTCVLPSKGVSYGIAEDWHLHADFQLQTAGFGTFQAHPLVDPVPCHAMFCSPTTQIQLRVARRFQRFATMVNYVYGQRDGNRRFATQHNDYRCCQLIKIGTLIRTNSAYING